MGKYIVHKAVEPDAVKKKSQKPLDFIKRNYIVQPKYDGCCVVVVTGAEHGIESYEVLTRTGEDVHSMAHVANAIMETQEVGLVFIGEAYQRGVPQATISGNVRRHTAAPDLEFVVFDVLTVAEFEAGYSPIPYKDRIRRYRGEFPEVHSTKPVRLCNSFAPGLIDPDYLMTQLMADGGYDGVILRDPEGTWTAGDGKTGEIIKIKQELSFDLEIVGVEEGKGKLAGMTGAIIFKWNGAGADTCKAIGGSFDERKAWFENPDLIIGKIGEVECMALTESGVPREPRFKGIRFDKLQAD